MKHHRLGVLLALVVCATANADTFSVTFKAVDPDNKPVANADVALFWDVQDGAMTPRGHKRTDAAGKAGLRVDDWNEQRPVLVLSADRRLGGIVGASKADAGKELTVTLRPTVRVKGDLACKELNFKPEHVITTVTTDGYRAYFTQNHNKTATLDFVLPPGTYTFQTRGTDAETISKKVTLEADQSEHAFGTLDMKADAIAKLRGKPAPTWVGSDTRGLKQGATLADYKGKWVYLEFWGFWCGPCCARSLPALIGLYEDHADHRDKFEVIAVHDSSLKSFAALDPKLPKLKERFWQGKELPFPIVLDAGATVTQYSVREFPTGLLIDPEGNLVGPASITDLEAKLPPVSAARKWARHRDLHRNISWAWGESGYTPTGFADFIKNFTQCVVEVDAEALKACGLTPESKLPLVMGGGEVSLRSIEELVLAPHGLGVVPAADGKKLLIANRRGADPASHLQKLHAKELNALLDRATAKPLEIEEQPLLDALKLVGREYAVPVALDPKALLAGKLDPKAQVRGRLGPGDLRTALTKLLAPLGLRIVVTQEVLLVTPRSPS